MIPPSCLPLFVFTLASPSATHYHLHHCTFTFIFLTPIILPISQYLMTGGASGKQDTPLHTEEEGANKTASPPPSACGPALLPCKAMGGFHHAVVAFTGVCAGVAVLLSAALIQQHLTHFSKPMVQSKIVGILWMVPIYTVQSWLSLSFKHYALYLDMFRDCYEAYVLYLFLALLVAYLGDGDEGRVVELLERQPRVKHVYPFKLCLGGGEVPHGAEFLKFCKFGTMQYIVLKPTCTLVAVILSACGLYGEGSFALNRFWAYQTLIMNVSVGYAFYCLGMFYVLLHGPLEVHNPVPKFLCIKAVLFLSFWQGVIIAALVRLGLLPHFGEWTTQNVAMAIQEVLICIEMVLVAFAHRYAFPVTDYMGAPALRTSLLSDHFSHTTALRDFNEVMPVLLPSNFTPGLAQSIDRSSAAGGGGGGNGVSPQPLPLSCSSSQQQKQQQQQQQQQAMGASMSALQQRGRPRDVEGGGGGGGGEGGWRRLSSSTSTLESGPSRKLGTGYGFEAVGGGGGGGGDYYGVPTSSSYAFSSSSAIGGAVGSEEGSSSSSSNGNGGSSPPTGAVPAAPSLGKGEALTLNKLPWRLNK